jgi:hypothetical protein
VELSKWGTTHEKGVPPDGVLERWETDREGFLAELNDQVTPGGR